MARKTACLTKRCSIGVSPPGTTTEQRSNFPPAAGWKARVQAASHCFGPDPAGGDRHFRRACDHPCNGDRGWRCRQLYGTLFGHHLPGFARQWNRVQREWDSAGDIYRNNNCEASYRALTLCPPYFIGSTEGLLQSICAPDCVLRAVGAGAWLNGSAPMQTRTARFACRTMLFTPISICAP
jgi:hypothetical protein